MSYRLITIFDCRLAINWAGTTSDGSEVKGRLDIPEISHENTVDEEGDYSVRPPIYLQRRRLIPSIPVPMGADHQVHSRGCRHLRPCQIAPAFAYGRRLP